MKIGFIGCGNMGGALAGCISGYKGGECYLYDLNKDKMLPLIERGCTEASGKIIAEECDFIFLGVKPAFIGVVLDEICDGLKSNPNSVIISMAAGVKIDKIEKSLPIPHPVIRIMPNTPVTLGKGMTVYSVNDLVDGENEKKFLSFMELTGELDKIPEDLIDAACAVSGCGPAFAYMFAAALSEGGKKCGLDKDRALVYAANMIKGAMDMILTVGKSPEQLKNEVCSPGGSTIEGVKALEERNFKETLEAAVIASYEKTKKLGN